MTQDQPQTIPLDGPTQRFYQGAATANKVLTAHADTEFPDEETRVALFHFYAGALAVSEYGCSTTEDFSHFLLGLNTRAPQPPEKAVESDLDGLVAYQITIGDTGQVVVEREGEDNQPERVTFHRHTRLAGDWRELAHQADFYLDEDKED